MFRNLEFDKKPILLTKFYNQPKEQWQLELNSENLIIGRVIFPSELYIYIEREREDFVLLTRRKGSLRLCLFVCHSKNEKHWKKNRWISKYVNLGTNSQLRHSANCYEDQNMEHWT